jgi:hypothetical protein
MIVFTDENEETQKQFVTFLARVVHATIAEVAVALAHSHAEGRNSL